MKKKFKLTSEFINLTQLLKASRIVGMGSDAHNVIMSGEVMVNGMIEMRKRAKLYTGDIVQIGDVIIEIE